MEIVAQSRAVCHLVRAARWACAESFRAVISGQVPVSATAKWATTKSDKHYCAYSAKSHFTFKWILLNFPLRFSGVGVDWVKTIFNSRSNNSISRSSSSFSFFCSRSSSIRWLCWTRLNSSSLWRNSWKDIANNQHSGSTFSFRRVCDNRAALKLPDRWIWQATTGNDDSKLSHRSNK